MDSRGFSLIELMMVVILIGIVVAIALPSFGSFRDNLVLSQARSQVTQDLRTARQAAVTRHCPVRVVFGDGATTTDVQNYSTHYDTNSDGVVATGELYVNHRMPSRSKLGLVSLTPADTVTFDLSGILLPPSAGGMLVVSSPLGRADTLYVSAAGVVYQP